MNKLFFLISFPFSILSSGYSFSFKKVDGIPEDIQICNGLSKEIQRAKEELDRIHLDCKKIDYAFDKANNTAACVEQVGGKYQVIFYNGKSYPFFPYNYSFKEKPLCLGVNKNILFKLDGKWAFSFIKIPLDKSREEYFVNGAESIKVSFDDETTKMIKKDLAPYDNTKVHCYSGGHGKFYLTHTDLNYWKPRSSTWSKLDQNDCQVYLFTIEEKAKAPESAKSLSLPAANKKTDEKPNANNPSRFSILKLCGMGLFVLGIVFLVYGSHELKIADTIKRLCQI